MKPNKISLILRKVRDNYLLALPRLLDLQLDHASYPSGGSRHSDREENVRCSLVNPVLNPVCTPTGTHPLSKFLPEVCF